MKRILLTFMVAATYMVQAKSEICPGYIVSLAGDTTKVKIDVPLELIGSDPSYAYTQYRVKYIDKKGKKGEYKYDEISAYGFTYKNEKHVYRAMPISWNLSGTYPIQFLRVMQDGPCTVF